MDFARPITPVEVASYIEDELRAMAKNERRKAELLIARAEGLEAAADAAFHNGRLWERHQPEARLSASSPTPTPEETP